MCGIVGYVGQRPACGIVVDALRRMEYRGYDSSGVALLDGNGGLTVRRRAGRLANLEAALADTDTASLAGSTGLGHTRWATHGRPTDRNAHPHRDATGKIAVVHNGIIENYASAARRARSRRCGIRQRHRHRDRRSSGRQAVPPRRHRRRLRGIGAGGPASAGGPFHVGLRQRRRSGHDRCGTALHSAGARRGGRRDVRRLGCSRLHRIHPRRGRTGPGPGGGRHRRRLSHHRFQRR